MLSQCEYTYVNHALGHKSIIYHFIVTRNIFDVIEANYVIYEPTNPSSHNIVLLSITSFIHDKLFVNRVLPNNIHVREPICAWDKASSVNIDQYGHALEYRLSAIDIDMGVFRCSNNKCQSMKHKHSIDRVCLWLITCCIEAGLETIPLIKPNDKTIPGWSVNVKHECEQSLFWHWIWSECGKPYSGTIYEIMKRTRHTYHYTVRRLKRNKVYIQKK